MIALLDPSSLIHCELCPRRCRANRAAGERGRVWGRRCAQDCPCCPAFLGGASHFGRGGVRYDLLLRMPTQVRLLPEPRDLDGGDSAYEVEPERLVEIMLELQAQGAHNINLVTATHFAHLLPDAIAEARSQGLSIPIVYNTSGYEREEAVAELGDLVDIWLVDYKYADASLGRALSHVPDYPEVASRALKRMCAEVARRGGKLIREDGIMERGVIVRHLVLPGSAADSCAVLDRVWESPGTSPSR